MAGRPSLQQLLSRVDEQVGFFHTDYGGLPRAVEADEILRELWIEDTFHSSALEGNVLNKQQVAKLLNEKQPSGTLSDSLEVEGYARAARWLYANAPEYPIDKGVPRAVISELHKTLVEAAWVLSPPDDHSLAGGYRKRGITISGSSVRTTPPNAIDGAIQDWIDQSGLGRHHEHVLIHVADHHAWFERIHPFADGNGRVGRLLMNFMLVQRGFPPAVLLDTSRRRYLDSLEKADRGNPSALTELIARAIESSINKFLIPRLAGDARLVPLAALAEGSEYSADYLRTLAVSGRLRAAREGRIWLSSRAWLKDYRRSRNSRGRRNPAEQRTARR